MRCRMTRLRRTADIQQPAPTDRSQSEADDSKGPPLAVSSPSPQTLIEPLKPRAA
jgi:hypothetical protein